MIDKLKNFNSLFFKIFSLVLILIFIFPYSKNIFAQSFNVNFSFLLTYVSLNTNSNFDIDLFNLNNFENFYISQFIYMGLGEFYSIKINLQIEYFANSISNNIEKFYIKVNEMNFSIINNYFYILFGKKYHRWGSSLFFNPIDILNVQNNRTEPFQNIGSCFSEILFPFFNWFSLSFFSFIKDDFYSKIENLPLITKISFNLNNLSFLVFGLFQKGIRPIYGFNIEYIFSFNNYFSLKIYNETIIKQETSRIYFEQVSNVYVEKNYNDQSYYSSVVGSNLIILFKNNIQTILKINFEIYYNNENWNDYKFKNFILYYESLDDSAKINFFNQFFSLFSNSNFYFWSNINIEKLIWEKLGFEIDFVYNVDDESYYINTKIILSLSQNIILIFNFMNFSGNEYSEFGNYLFKYQLGANMFFYF